MPGDTNAVFCSMSDQIFTSQQTFRKSSEYAKDRYTGFVYLYGAPFVKILYLTDLAQKLLSLRIFSYLCAEIAISAQR